MSRSGTQLGIELRTEGESARLVLAGELDLVSTDRLRAAIDDAAGSHEAIVLDLSGLTFIDSSGIAVLVEALRRPNGYELTLSLAGANEDVTRLLEVTGVVALGSER